MSGDTIFCRRCWRVLLSGCIFTTLSQTTAQEMQTASCKLFKTFMITVTIGAYTHFLCMIILWLFGVRYPPISSVHFPDSCHNHDTRSTLYHSVWSCPRVCHPFHCMYLHFLIISILLVLPLIGECSVCSVSPYDYLICFRLQFRLLSVPISLYLLIQYTSGNRSPISPGLLISLCDCTRRCSSVFLTPQASPCTFYSSI